jgi:hypothetical protein
MPRTPAAVLDAPPPIALPPEMVGGESVAVLDPDPQHDDQPDLEPEPSPATVPVPPATPRDTLDAGLQMIERHRREVSSERDAATAAARETYRRALFDEVHGDASEAAVAIANAIDVLGLDPQRVAEDRALIVEWRRHSDAILRANELRAVDAIGEARAKRDRLRKEFEEASWEAQRHLTTIEQQCAAGLEAIHAIGRMRLVHADLFANVEPPRPWVRPETPAE